MTAPESPLRHTPLDSLHRELGGKMTVACSTGFFDLVGDLLDLPIMARMSADEVPRVRPGDELQYEIRVRNHDTVDKSGRLVLSGTPGVQFSTEGIDIAVAAGETAAFEVTARFPDSYQTHAWTLTVDVTWDGVRHGQIAEAIAWW